VITTNERFENFIEDGDDRFSEIELRVLDLEKDISDWRAARTRSVTDPARRRTRERGAAGPGYPREPGPDLAEVDYQPEFAEHGISWEADEPEPGWEADEPEPAWEAGELEPEPAPAVRGRRAAPQREFLRATGNPARGHDHGRAPAAPVRSGRLAAHTRPIPADERLPAADRTQELIDRGRQTARPRTVRRPAVKQKAARPKAARPKAARRGRWRHRRTIVAGSVAGLAVLGIGAMIILRPGPSWPASVATVRTEITTACQNPNVASEPSQVNFACAKDTSQILWVFSLLTSGNDPGYADAKSGRKGLEPITPTQGGEIAWSLNLHHPYNPLSPVDSLEVAARAINNIIGGATLTSTNGNPTVQPGLEGKPANCARYTGSSAIVSHAGFPSLCASPVTSLQGQAALVADVYKQWMPGASAVAAQNASVLFQNAGNPGDPQVQAILKTLPHGQ
jgi:hypothetical protein